MRKVSERQPLNAAAFPVPRGQVYVIVERCKGCDFCIEFCPRDVLEQSEGINSRGYHYPVVAEGKGDECVHCQFCTLVCPEFAIYTDEPAATAR